MTAGDCLNRGWVGLGPEATYRGGTEAVDTCLQVVPATDRGTRLEYTFIGFGPRELIEYPLYTF